MNIGFDAKRAFYNRTGLGNYSRNLIEALHQYYPQNLLQLYVPKIKSNHLFKNIEGPNIEVINNKTIVPDSNWRAWSIKNSFLKYNTQIYHGLSAELPLGKKPEGIQYVVTIHDLIYERYPELYKIIDRNIYRKKTIAACEKADLIIAISEQTKRDLISYYQIEPNKIEVVYQNCDLVFAQKVSSSKLQLVKEKYQLPSSYLLSVGTLEKRKNTKVILEALVHLPKDVQLVLVGKSSPYADELLAFIEQHQLSNRVKILNNVGFDDLPAIYQMAEIFIYPSIFEGFGIPIIEALSSGIPVIAATGSCLEEAGGPDSLYFDPYDVPTLVNHIAGLRLSQTNRMTQIEKGLVYVKRFSAAAFAEDTQNIYQKLLQH